MFRNAPSDRLTFTAGLMESGVNLLDLTRGAGRRRRQISNGSFGWPHPRFIRCCWRSNDPAWSRAAPVCRGASPFWSIVPSYPRCSRDIFNQSNPLCRGT